MADIREWDEATEAWGDGQIPVRVLGGNTYQYSPDMPFKDAVREAARAARLTRFSAFIVHNGTSTEVTPDNAPETLGDIDGEGLSLVPYDKAG